MTQTKQLLGLDVGAARIGVAVGDTGVRIAVPREWITVDGTELRQITALVKAERIAVIVVGYPRNQSGQATEQTQYVMKFAESLQGLEVPIEFQDESLTSVLAEKRLNERGKPYEKGDIDSEAAAIILQDYMEQRA